MEARIPPHDIDAEMCVLGSMMLCGDDVERFALVRARVRRDAFYQADHQIIYDALCSMADAGTSIDAVTTRAELIRRGLFEEIGGRDYLASILGTMPSAAHGEHYANLVREKYLLRGAIASANDILHDCYAPAAGAGYAADLLRTAAGRILELVSTGTADRFTRMADAVRMALEAKRNGKASRLATGLYEFDYLCGGLPIGKFVLIGGRPGMGKSLLCKQIVLNVAAARLSPCGIVTVEEDERKVAQNAISNYSGIENCRVTYGNFGPEEWAAVATAAERLGTLDIWVNDRAVTLGEVEDAVTTAAVRHKCRVVVVDYLQLIDPEGKGENENREITRISQALKRLAKRLDIVLMAACQLNRGNENGGVRPPTLRDLRGSGTLEQDGDLIVLLHREDYYLPDDRLHERNHQLKAIVAKNKDGPQATIPLLFDAKTQRISDWPAPGGVPEW